MGRWEEKVGRRQRTGFMRVGGRKEGGKRKRVGSDGRE